ncbi:urea carboxylase-associated family protein [Sinimarinibacterium sp. CAU 1509]|uniref:urea amidolyase associated protein UAAP1 n=1 Tax=Sinimarinibacterium sp. CAU 1509 TaxID=2562283 RepID=UPI0010ACA67B|nr:urea amidolyase associated protein UAAP1 [Sinimarinibacterium sp. CAU 1509]TJY58378.1 urea carboxylase-associated family protein [Sinimarinibacterium sp. CAU 1509]
MTALSPIAPSALLWQETVPGGCHWSGLMRRGSALRLTDLDGGANVSALFFNQEEKLERYNMPDSLKAQHTAFLTTGNVLMSDMGRVLCSIIGDELGWHDTVCGLSDANSIREKYGEARYQTHRNAMHRSARDGLLVELGKWGLGKRDLVANANFFSKVVPDADGYLGYVTGHSRAGAALDLRFDMNVLVVLSTAPHPLAPAGAYRPAAVELSAWHAGVAAPDDVCRLHCPQNQRAFTNTDRYFAQ